MHHPQPQAPHHHPTRSPHRPPRPPIPAPSTNNQPRLKTPYSRQNPNRPIQKIYGVADRGKHQSPPPFQPNPAPHRTPPPLSIPINHGPHPRNRAPAAD